MSALQKSTSLQQRDRFYRDTDIREKIDELEAKVSDHNCALLYIDRSITCFDRLQKNLWTTTIFLAYSSLGVIYGDIGTSPLYVFSSIFVGEP